MQDNTRPRTFDGQRIHSRRCYDLHGEASSKPIYILNGWDDLERFIRKQNPPLILFNYLTQVNKCAEEWSNLVNSMPYRLREVRGENTKFKTEKKTAMTKNIINV